LNLPFSAGADHLLTFSNESQQWTIPVKAGPHPVLAVFIASAETQPVNLAPGAKTTATLVVKVTPALDGVHVLVNDATRGSTKAGKRTISGLPAGSYTVKVAEEGYESTPANATAQLKPGASRTLAFTLHKAGPPAEASFEIQNAIPDSEVFVDGTRVGAASAAGSFSWGHMKPGTNTIRLEHYEYQPELFEQSFAGGQVTTLPARQERAWLVIVDTVIVDRAASTPQITYRSGSGPEQVMSPGPKWLPPGSYTFTAHWGDKQCSQDANVVPNANNAPVTLTFRSNCK
jgi:hypothetical protein